jgi:metal-sulfur cluster biosynthetic enzyme
MCPMGGIIVRNIEDSLNLNFKDYKINVEITLSPPWTPDKMNPAIRDQFGF